MSFKKKIEDEMVKDDYEAKSLMCQATGCPNKWSVHMGSRLCSKHAWADPMDWGSITSKLTGNQLMSPPVRYHTEVDDDAIY